MLVRRFLTVAVSGLAVFLGSCVTNSASIFISGAIAPDSATCTYDPSGTLLAETTVDVAIPSAVRIGFVVNNLIQKRNFNVETDVSTAIVTQAEVSLTDASGASLAGGAFLVDTAGGVVEGSNDGIAPGQGVVFVEVMPASVVAGFAGIPSETTIIANITLRGRTLGNIDLEGGPFPWAITLLPAGSLASSTCTVGSTRTCCSAGRGNEVYCTNTGGCEETN